ncbi:unnamed protein product, partial [Allacma fusca]
MAKLDPQIAPSAPGKFHNPSFLLITKSNKLAFAGGILMRAT